MKVKERIFITDNPFVETQVHLKVTLAFGQCKEAAKIVKDFGFTLTHDIIIDCLSLRKVTKPLMVDGIAKWVGEETGRYPKLYPAVDVFECDEHLKKELEKMLQDISNGNGSANKKAKEAEALKSEYKAMLERVYGLFHKGHRTIETSDLLRYIKVEDGDISLPDDINERIKADTATYAETEKGIAAYRLHHEISKSLNTLADLMCNASRDNFTTNLQSLFMEDDNGNVCPMPIDYDLFTN